MKPVVIGLDRYRLEPKNLTKLGDAQIRCHGSLHYPPLESLYNLSPEGRNIRIQSFLIEEFQQVYAKWPGHQVQFETREGKVGSSFKGHFLAKEFPLVWKISEISHLWIDRIQGLRKTRLPRELSYFSVFGRVAVQVEGESKGLQSVEDRIVLVRAYSSDNAVKRLEQEWEKHSKPYLNENGELVRWKLDEIVDVYDLRVDEIDPMGTEVYSRLWRRRIKPEFEWHPIARNGELV